MAYKHAHRAIRAMAAAIEYIERSNDGVVTRLGEMVISELRAGIALVGMKLTDSSTNQSATPKSEAGESEQ